MFWIIHLSVRIDGECGDCDIYFIVNGHIPSWPVLLASLVDRRRGAGLAPKNTCRWLSIMQAVGSQRETDAYDHVLAGICIDEWLVQSVCLMGELKPHCHHKEHWVSGSVTGNHRLNSHLDWSCMADKNRQLILNNRFLSNCRFILLWKRRFLCIMNVWFS